MDSIIPMEPADFMIMRNQQEMLTSPQLSAYIDKQRQRGIANIKEFEIEYVGDRSLPYTVEKDEDGKVTCIYCSYDPETLGKDPADGRKVKGVIHWVSATHSLPAEVRLYDRLFKVPNPGAEDDFEAALNPESLVIIEGARVEASLKDAKPEFAYQFEREGYFCADNKLSSAERLVFNRTVALRDVWGKAEA